MWTEELSVDEGEFRPLEIGAIGIEGVIVLSLDGLWGLGSGEGIWGIGVAILALREELTGQELGKGDGSGTGNNHLGMSSR